MIPLLHIYLPIAGMQISLPIILLLGLGIGVLTGLLGVGGFLLTPLLLFLGIPAPVAVATTPAQLVGSALSGVMAHARRGNVDFKMSAILVAGGLSGSALGVWIFHMLRHLGQVNLVLSLCFLVILGGVGSLMSVESFGALRRRRQGQCDIAGPRKKLHKHTWLHALPLKMRFHRSGLYISALVPFGCAFVVALIAALLGVGGGFMIVPAMIYLVGMPTSVVIGTSLVQVLFANGNATFLQAVMNHTLDIELAVLMVVTGVIGAQIGARLSSKVPGEHLRALLAVMILGVAGKFAYGLFATPTHMFSVVQVAMH